jgi:hypothetical protein
MSLDTIWTSSSIGCMIIDTLASGKFVRQSHRCPYLGTFVGERRQVLVYLCIMFNHSVYPSTTAQKVAFCAVSWLVM